MPDNNPDVGAPLPAVILSGGRSSRMGAPKALVRWPPTGEPFLACAVRVLHSAGLDPLGVVTGTHHAEIAPLAEALGVTGVFNPGHEAGQLSSLQCGLAWAFARTAGDWVLATLVDVPGVDPATIRHLMAETRHAKGWLVRPDVGGRHGHPVIWHRAAMPRLLAADPARGARALVHELVAEGRVRDVPVDDMGVLVDIDTMADLEAMHPSRASRGRPLPPRR